MTHSQQYFVSHKLLSLYFVSIAFHYAQPNKFSLSFSPFRCYLAMMCGIRGGESFYLVSPNGEKIILHHVSYTDEIYCTGPCITQKQKVHLARVVPRILSYASKLVHILPSQHCILTVVSTLYYPRANNIQEF